MLFVKNVACDYQRLYIQYTVIVKRTVKHCSTGFVQSNTVISLRMLIVCILLT